MRHMQPYLSTSLEIVYSLYGAPDEDEFDIIS